MPKISERCFKINHMEYHLKLIPKTYFDSEEQKPFFLRQLSMMFSETHQFIKVKGIVEYEKKMWRGYIEKQNNEKTIGKFQEEWHESLKECKHYLIIDLTKERPKKRIFIEDLDYDEGGRVELNKLLIEKVGGKTRRSPLKEI